MQTSRPPRAQVLALIKDAKLGATLAWERIRTYLASGAVDFLDYDFLEAIVWFLDRNPCDMSLLRDPDRLSGPYGSGTNELLAYRCLTILSHSLDRVLPILQLSGIQTTRQKSLVTKLVSRWQTLWKWINFFAEKSLLVSSGRCERSMYEVEFPDIIHDLLVHLEATCAYANQHPQLTGSAAFATVLQKLWLEAVQAASFNRLRISYTLQPCLKEQVDFDAFVLNTFGTPEKALDAFSASLKVCTTSNVIDLPPLEAVTSIIADTIRSSSLLFFTKYSQIDFLTHVVAIISFLAPPPLSTADKRLLASAKEPWVFQEGCLKNCTSIIDSIASLMEDEAMERRSLAVGWLTRATEIKLIPVLCGAAAFAHGRFIEHEKCDINCVFRREGLGDVLSCLSIILQAIFKAFAMGSIPMRVALKKSLKLIQREGAASFTPSRPTEPREFWDAWRIFSQSAWFVLERSKEFRVVRCDNVQCNRYPVIVDGILQDDMFTEIRQCGGCAAAFYCSRSCQRQGWTQGHSKVCSTHRRAPETRGMENPRNWLNVDNVELHEYMRSTDDERNQYPIFRENLHQMGL